MNLIALDCKREIDPNKMKGINEPLKVAKNPKRQKKKKMNWTQKVTRRE